MVRRSFAPELKQEAVRQVTELGKSVTSVARKLEIAPTLLHIWMRASREAARSPLPKAPSGSGEAELARLRREVAELREENSFLKKAAAYFAKERPRGTE